MPHQDSRFRYPKSRDWGYGSFICKATKCIANELGYCIAPSLCKINEDGKCANFKEKK